MHIYPASLIGISVWIGTVAYLPSIWTLLACPLIVSSVTAICLFARPLWLRFRTSGVHIGP